MIFAAVRGATFPGSPSAHTTSMPASRAASISTPPGFEAKSIIKVPLASRRMLLSIIKNFNGGPVGLETLAAVIGEESVTIEDVYEPYLMQIGFLVRTPRGRCVSKSAYEHLGCRYTPNDNGSSQISMEDDA